MSEKKEYVNKKIRDNVDEETLEWVQQRYLPYLKRQGLKEGTESNRLQALKKLVLIEGLRPEKWGENNTDIKELGKKVAGNIQANDYVEQGDKGMSKRRKRLCWTCFKNIVEIEGYDPSILPDFSPKVTRDVNRRSKNTDADQIPGPEQVKKFVKALGKYSKDCHVNRNQALVLLLWDKGPRIGEALNIQMKDVEIRNDRVFIDIEGNKKAGDDEVEILDGRETMKEFIRQHPGTGEDYLFSDLDHNKLSKPVDRGKFANKHKQVAAAEDFDFKVKGEPNHIFRKAFVSAHVVNEWATWEDVCNIQRVSQNKDKPTYLKMLIDDVQKKVAKKKGVRNEKQEEESHMLGEPLLPQKCKACGKINKCFLETCQYCSGDLKTPTRSAFQQEPNESEKMKELEELQNQIQDKMEELE